VTPTRALEGVVAVVTGGSRGIGAAVVRTLAREGAAVAVNFLSSREAAEEVVGEVRADGGRAIDVLGDVGDVDQANEVVRRVVEEFGGLDVLVNNAGIIKRGTLADHSVEDRNEVLRINLGGTFNAIQAALPHLKAAKGSVVNISSIAGQTGDLPASPSYGASKGGINALTRSLARELGPDGVRVNAVAPHAIATDMSSEWSDERRKEIVSSIPLGRLGRPEEVAEAVTFLASPAAAFITGVVLDINGGYWMG
jgi:3-oxoacyl-[acyl-carrier protein] reductase